jgi:hypothetical protein
MQIVKKKIVLSSAVLLGFFLTIWYSCEPDPKETCLQDEICQVTVTACCDDNNVCVYKYNGKEYTEDQLGDLANELGCVAVRVEEESISQKTAVSEVVEELKALMSRVRERTHSTK